MSRRKKKRTSNNTNTKTSTKSKSKSKSKSTSKRLILGARLCFGLSNSHQLYSVVETVVKFMTIIAINCKSGARNRIRMRIVFVPSVILEKRSGMLIILYL